ncbi:Hypothetical predicted protein [Podarcis lilfordi]|uniref:Uncharacterized protein n=1 Tax=Podarcis lilfordi TaxID=74358 RepID=A0AA35JV97_9SAUR|nr:Hypothetical predicted protein [Podarcis lilfordi]
MQAPQDALKYKCAPIMPNVSYYSEVFLEKGRSAEDKLIQHDSFSTGHSIFHHNDSNLHCKKINIRSCGPHDCHLLTY